MTFNTKSSTAAGPQTVICCDQIYQKT